ncbi:MAG: hypothetical protein QOJ59_552 [Thermomicrobiales bacterium]|jgi:uncharacterized protein YgiM (DUF1202 family)|nr:hypothetical protein [Thermomicrobiales bacterium]
MLFAPASPSVVRASTDLTIGGWAVVADANGDSVRLREDAGPSGAIISSHPEGTVVDVIEGPVESSEDGSLWYEVAVDGQTGFMAAIYLARSDAESLPTAGDAGDPPAVTGSAVIVNSNGDDIRCRAAPNTEAEILFRFVEGDFVELLGDAVDRWQPVRCADQAGYVAAEFIGSGDAPTAPEGDESESDDESFETAEITTSGMGEIRGTNGDGVRCRAKANLSGSIIAVLSEGTQVPLRGAAKGDWQPVTCAGKNGFVYSIYIGPLDDSDGDSGGDDTGGGSNSDLQAGETAVVTGTNGDGVRLRSRASFDSAVITVVREGQQVKVRGGSGGDWVAVTYKRSDGFIHLDYLARADAGGGDGGSGGGSGGGLGVGDHAMVTDNLRLRADASLNGEVLGIAASSTVVVVTGAKSGGFYPVDWDGLEGWMYADYLSWTDAAITPRETGVGGDAGSGPGSANGQAMVDYAMPYLGYRYVWATHGPNTFDCSGFTYWVTLHVLGQNIGTGTWTQSIAGRPVAYGELQPGDLVFFQNTFTWGLSHVGIYIGNNQFIHAENEQTGVRISSLTSPYYSTRWYGARRVG